ncbi:MAG: 23S rRNA (adenine(2030)-N(6))-methyltransferase RlmJ [Bifidobacteriaceae bacterium]|jgi:16S rRNA (guanine966-N2)-methyltransferase|nr:23S rRNA (adenine(2030)-N(6))-methyltransferase RlmJ [Bifidobacteriaceae bacterium]
MQIISGKYKNYKLPDVQSVTRPTTSMVKESIFSSLESIGAINNADVFDLFAGSGALGFEAISRGARSVTFYDSSQKVTNLLKQITKKYDFDEPINIEKLDVYKKSAQQFQTPPDQTIPNQTSPAQTTPNQTTLVFIDPPYEHSDDQILQLLNTYHQNINKITFVIERNKKSTLDKTYQTVLPNAELIKMKTYGDTKIFILQYN